MQFDRELIKACSDGDRKAQEELYKKCFAPLLSICYRFANNKDDAVILLNEAFYKILTNIEKQNPDIPFFAWAKRITVNYCIDEYKKANNKKKVVAEAEDADELENKANLTIDEEETERYPPDLLAKAKEEILNLPATTQEVFQLFALEGYSHREIADIMGIKEGTSKWHVNNARKMLKAVLKRSMKVMSTLVL